MHWRCRDRLIDLSRPQVMGILNVTPDSFSDGGRYAAIEAAVRRAEDIAVEGGTIIDVGGESTRPGAAPVSDEIEMSRVVPVIEAIVEKLRVANLQVAISIDTSKPRVMAAAVAAGACIINDVRALQAPQARACAAQTQAGVCLVHMQGDPGTMQVSPHYNDVTHEVTAFLRAQIEACIAAGIGKNAIVVDPGIGFGKTLAHSLELLRDLRELATLEVPVLVGVSRKSLIGRILGGRDLHHRLHGGLGLAALAVSCGARIIRTHDVGATVDAVRAVDVVLHGQISPGAGP